MASLIAKLEGGGYERPDADKQLPLDINYAKLGEWLVRPPADGGGGCRGDSSCGPAAPASPPACAWLLGRMPPP